MTFRDEMMVGTAKRLTTHDRSARGSMIYTVACPYDWTKECYNNCTLMLDSLFVDTRRRVEEASLAEELDGLQRQSILLDPFLFNKSVVYVLPLKRC